MTLIKLSAALLALTLAACGAPPGGNETAGNVITSAGAVEPAAATPTPSPAASQAAERYLGHWIGVEGMVLDVTARPGGGVRLAMQYDLDHKGNYDGSVTGEGVRFVRDGETLLARSSDGDATGLKWLAGKKNCLTVKSGEGYCRD